MVEKEYKNLDKMGWDLFVAGGMQDIELYSATVGAAKQFSEEKQKKREEEGNQPEF